LAADALDLSRLRPAGGKHSSKRDQILRIFLQQEGHLSADDLFDLVRRQASGIFCVTLYFTFHFIFLLIFCIYTYLRLFTVSV